MKQRKGFVSNSSSSSFIIGLGVVSPDKITDELLNDSNIQLKTYEDLLELQQYDDLTLANDTVSLGSFTSASIECGDIASRLTDGSKLAVLSFDGDEGDSEFVDDDYDIDYDIDEDHFGSTERQSMDLINRLGGECTYGAGRNG